MDGKESSENESDESSEEVVVEVNAYSASGIKTCTIFSAAREGKTEEIYALVKFGSRVNSRDETGRTPLMIAAINNHKSTVITLIELGAKPNMLDRGGNTALALALRNGHKEIAKILAKCTRRGDYYINLAKSEEERKSRKSSELDTSDVKRRVSRKSVSQRRSTSTSVDITNAPTHDIKSSGTRSSSVDPLLDRVRAARMRSASSSKEPSDQEKRPS